MVGSHKCVSIDTKFVRDRGIEAILTFVSNFSNIRLRLLLRFVTVLAMASGFVITVVAGVPESRDFFRHMGHDM